MKDLKKQVVGIRLSEQQVIELREQAKHLTLSCLGRLLFEMYLRGEIVIN